MKDLKPIWLKYGVLYGIVSILISLFSYYISFIGLGLQTAIGFIVPILFMYLAAKELREENGGQLSFGAGLKEMFFTGLVGAAISVLFTIVIINFIDPGLIDKMTEMSVESTRSMMESLGVPDDQIEEAIENAEESAASGFTPLNLMMGLVISAVFTFIIAAVMALIMKKERDPFDDENIGGEFKAV
ncbi:MAG: DUF4199 domain-containing protein [Saprospiraceae bacterium]|nr:MAG: hypothetical protein UZ09_BCD002000389 [Bacteroidetes bacterium OLB9]MCO6462895.1 DUF4199 domain-containing protein [Saprospiraceae bacterium]